MNSPNTSKVSLQQNHQNVKRKGKKKSKKSAKKKAKLNTLTTEQSNQASKVWTEFDEVEQLCLPNYMFVPTTHSETNNKFPDNYDVNKYLALRSAPERRQYRNSNDLRTNIQSKSDEPIECADYAEHRLCHKQLRGQRCDNPMCSYKHDFRVPRKLRLCSEWRKGPCADGNRCLYLHSEFPCRYHYLGMKSQKHNVNTCRYFHGGPLSKEFEEMFLDTIDSTKLPMFRQMYSKTLSKLRKEVDATVKDSINVERKENTTFSCEFTEQQEQAIDSCSRLVKDSAFEKSVEEVEDKKENTSDVTQPNEPDRSKDQHCEWNDFDLFWE